MAKRQGGTYTAKWVRLPPCALINNNIKHQLIMDEKTKNILSYVISILIVGGATTYCVIDPNNFLDVFLWIILPIIILAFIGILVAVIADMLYEFFSSDQFEEMYHKYKSKQNRHNT